MLRFLLAGLVVLAAVPATANPQSTALRTSAYQHLYNLDYPEARRDMEAAVKADPDDLAAERGLAVIAWLEISFQRGTLTVDEYLGKATVSDVKTVPPPPALASTFEEHVARAQARAE